MAEDRNAVERRIHHLINSYAWSIDQRDWTAFSSVFCERIAIDYESFSGMKPTTVVRDEYVPHVRDTISGFDVTQHQISNILISGANGLFTAKAYLVAYHFLGMGAAREKYVLGGFYDLAFFEAGPELRIASIRLTSNWTEGDFAIWRKAKKIWMTR